jgi:hypothetical protein
MARASSRNCAPASVSAMPRGSRRKSGVPISRSSCWICWLSGGWPMPRRAAARVKCSSSATAVK